MKELYLFDQDDNFITILSKDEGLVDTWFKDYQNHIPDESFVFNVDSNSELLQHIKEENQVAFYDRDGDLRLVRMKELYEVTTKDGHNIRVKCEPSFLELYDHFIEDKRITNGTAQTALNRALEGSRYIGEVTVNLGNATDNFYWIDGIGAIFKILGTWGGALKDTITLDEDNEIVERKIWIVQRLGTDNGLIVEPDHNAEQIGRKTLSYVETALWGQGASLEIDETGGYTRYITFEDVEWKVSNGDPVDKPLGQKWVGDPQALSEHGYLHNGVRKHRFGHFSNQDYDNAEELLMATWNELQERKLKEVIHEATIYEDDKKVSLGETVTILDRNYNKPIELQSQITGLEYDILDDKEIVIIVGKYIDMNEDRLQKDVDDLKEQIRRPRPTEQINNGSFPNIKPGTPVNVSATGAFQTIQLFWDYDSNVYISHYEVYGSQISDFVPDEQHLLYRGRVSSFSHEVDTDEMWYYYIRAVNTRGTVGEFSNRVSASTVRIISDDILFGSITSDLLADNLDLANKLTPSTFDDITQNLNIIGDVNILNGTTIIQDGVVGTAAIANLAVSRAKIDLLAVGTAQIDDLAVRSAKIAKLAVDDSHIANLSVNKLLSGEIDTSKIKIRGGSAVDYIDIYDNNIMSHGQFTRTWGGETDTARLRLGLFGGRVRITNDDTGYNLYMTEKGLSTTMSGASEISAGTIEFHSQRYNQVSRGVTVHSTYGTVALVSDYSTVVLDSDRSISLNSAQAGIYFRPMQETRIGINEFIMRVKESSLPTETDGWLSFGRSDLSHGSGIRFSRYADPIIYATDIDGNVGTGSFYANRFLGDLAARGTGYLYLMADERVRITDRRGYNNGNFLLRDLEVSFIQANSIRVTSSGANFYIGTSTGEVRVTDNNLSSGGYRPIRARELHSSGDGVYVNNAGRLHNSGNGVTYVQGNTEVRATRYLSGTLVPMIAQTFNTSSLANLKQDIEVWKESALEEIRQATIYQYRLKDEVVDGINHVKYGFVIGDGYCLPQQVLSRDRKSVDMYSHNSLNTKAIKELDTKVINIEDRLDEKDLQIQYLEQKIQLLEEKVA